MSTNRRVADTRACHFATRTGAGPASPRQGSPGSLGAAFPLTMRAGPARREHGTAGYAVQVSDHSPAHPAGARKEEGKRERNHATPILRSPCAAVNPSQLRWPHQGVRGRERAQLVWPGLDPCRAKTTPAQIPKFAPAQGNPGKPDNDQARGRTMRATAHLAFRGGVPAPPAPHAQTRAWGGRQRAPAPRQAPAPALASAHRGRGGERAGQDSARGILRK